MEKIMKNIATDSQVNRESDLSEYAQHDEHNTLEQNTLEPEQLFRDYDF